jgi:ribosomal protein L20A (L18A)
MQLSIKSNVKELQKDIGRLFRDQVPFVTSQAINDTAFDVRKGLQDTLQQDIDKPIPWTVRGVLVGRQRATKRNLIRTVDMDQARYEYMKYQLFGGRREPKRKLIAIGRNVKRNKYGNVSRATLKRLEGRADTYWGTERNHWGLWQRKPGHRLSLLVGGVASADYKPRVSWFSDAQQYVKQSFNKNFARRFRSAIE